MAKELMYKGKNLEELKKLSVEEFMKLTTARQRRSLKRGFNPAQKLFLARLKKFKSGGTKKPVKTHCRDMIVIPEMLGAMIHVHKGKDFAQIEITPEMLGHYLGEFAQTRQKVGHSAPGIGATRSSSGIKKAKG